MEDNKYLNAARTARAEENTADAKRYYEMVKLDDPDNGEAKFFYAYYTILEGTKGEALDNFLTFGDAISSAVKSIATSDMPELEKEKLLCEMVAVVKKMPMFMYNVLNSIAKTSVGKARLEKGNQYSITMLYFFGNEVEEVFSDNESIMIKVAVESWKAAIDRQVQWLAVPYDKKYPATYEAKIRKYVPSYTAPRANPVLGCIANGIRILGKVSG